MDLQIPKYGKRRTVFYFATAFAVLLSTSAVGTASAPGYSDAAAFKSGQDFASQRLPFAKLEADILALTNRPD